MDLAGDDKRAGDDIAERLIEFAVRVIKLANALPNTIIAKSIITAKANR